jgi:hypothetical protein
VRCLYTYHTREQWRGFTSKHGLVPIEERWSMNLYPPIFEQLFGGSLHYLGVHGSPPTAAAAAPNASATGAARDHT